MIVGVHTIVYSTDAEKDRAFFRDVLGFDAVDAGHGWLIFAQPPAELAVHPTDGQPKHELYFMCDNIETTVAELSRKGASFYGSIEDQNWGLVVTLVLPGGGTVGLYEPRHPTAIALS